MGLSSIPNDFLLPDGHPDYVRLIKSSRVYDVVKETPLTYAARLSGRLRCNVWLKREDVQPIFSFKLRGAYNKMAHLSETERSRGVVACSAGNHGQGVAYSAQKLGVAATIVMPLSTPYIKSTNIAQLGGKPVLHGHDFDEAKAKCAQLAAVHCLTNVPPFDDPFVIAGQGTIGMEIVNQIDPSKLEAIFCAVGGGGLVAGIGTYIKRAMPHVKIIGVVPTGSGAMLQSLALGRRVKLSHVNKFADGVAVKVVGKETFRICSKVVDQMVEVDTEAICEAIRDVYEETRVVLEPAGALALAGLKLYARATSTDAESTRAFVAVASGANMDFDGLKYVAEHAAANSGDDKTPPIPDS